MLALDCQHKIIIYTIFTDFNLKKKKKKEKIIQEAASDGSVSLWPLAPDSGLKPWTFFSFGWIINQKMPVRVVESSAPSQISGIFSLLTIIFY
jgi:hypothetical protein